MNDVIEKIRRFKLIPVVKIENAKDAVPLGKALLNGGLGVAEITFRTDAAEQAIKNLTSELPELFVGAGTVLKIDQVKKAVDAGAKFIVSPGFNPKVVEYCVKKGIVITPGVNSPTQIEMALDHGLTTVKFFPAEASGGLKLLNAMAAPYVGVTFIPTGGITKDNMVDYLTNKSVLAVGGSWIVKSDLIANGKFDEISALVRESVSVIEAL